MTHSVPRRLENDPAEQGMQVKLLGAPVLQVALISVKFVKLNAHVGSLHAMLMRF